MKSFTALSLAAALLAIPGAYAVAEWGQCGGLTYTGSTTCDSGLTCVYVNDYYSQCQKGTATTTAGTTASTTQATTTAGTTVTPAADNPYTGYELYLSPYYAAEVTAAAALITDATQKAKALAVAKIPTFTWLDTIAKVPDVGTYLKAALALQSSTGKKYIVQLIVYDLPDRDCHANASNGELHSATGGEAAYKTQYIDAIVAQIKANPGVRIVAIIEPDSLANLVTNLSDSRCSAAQDVYKRCITYAMQQLNTVGVYMYLDAGHAGWLGWPANITPAAQLFGSLYTSAGSPSFVRGLASNVANYNALSAATPDPITSGNANYDEVHYVNALAPLLTSNKFPAHFIVDQGRSGVQNIRSAWGNWCNVNNAGFGMRPTLSTTNSYIDAIVWAKPGGECDGTSNTSSTRYDSFCGNSDAKKPAPEAGTWFQDYFTMLVANANPAL